MKMYYGSVIDLLKTTVILFSSAIIISFIIWAYKRHQKLQLFKKYGIPGPQPEFFYGNLRHLKATGIPHDVIATWLKQYGNVFGYYIGEKPYLIVNNLDWLKQAMVKDFHNFRNKPDQVILMKPLNHSVLFLKDQRWKEIRSLLTPIFTPTKMRFTTKIINEKVSTLLDIITDKANKDEKFDVCKLVKALSLDVIGDCALAMKTNCQRDPDDPFFTAVRKFFLHFSNTAGDYVIKFPFIASIVKFFYKHITAGKMTFRIINNVKRVINIRRKNAASRGVDLLQLILDIAETKDTENPVSTKKPLLTDDEIIGNACVFLLAGYGTVANNLAFIFYHLINHPEIQDKLYDEIVNELKCKDELSYDDVQELQYMDRVLKESLRVYPVSTSFINRECKCDYTFGDITVPKGAILQAPIWNIHHDPEFWPDPWKFDPERFTPEGKANMHSLSFSPFGIGPRACIGMKFALLEIKISVARLVQKFRFIPCAETDDPIHLLWIGAGLVPKDVFIKAVSRI